ncbi:MAG: hypothetical protein AAF957_23290 [Planctomycetota bacterium]
MHRLLAAALCGLLGACAAATNPRPIPASLAVAPPAPSLAEGEIHKHHVGLFNGVGFESREGRPDEEGFAFGAEYTYRFDPVLAVGGVVEGIGQDVFRDAVTVALVSAYPTHDWRFFVGPGLELTESGKIKYVTRFGTGYDIHLGAHWSISPEIYVDLVEGGSNLWMAGAAIGYGW